MLRRLALASVFALASAVLVAAPVSAATTTCGVPPPTTSDPTWEPDIRSGTHDHVVVPAGLYCLLDGATVRGNVTVGAAGQVEILGSTVRGNVSGAADSGVFLGESSVGGNVTARTDAGTQAFDSTIGGNYLCDGCFFEDLYGSTVRGNVSIHSAELGDFVCRSEIRGSLEIRNSSSLALAEEPGFTYAFEVGFSTIRGNVTLANNTGPILVSANTINGNLTVSRNDVRHAATYPSFEGCGLVEPNAQSDRIEYDFGEISGNTVGGNASVSNTTGEMLIATNVIRGILTCSGNTLVTGAGNTAAQKSGQCRSL